MFLFIRIISLHLNIEQQFFDASYRIYTSDNFRLQQYGTFLPLQVISRSAGREMTCKEEALHGLGEPPLALEPGSLGRQ
jgi:hypothetical protein